MGGNPSKRRWNMKEVRKKYLKKDNGHISVLDLTLEPGDDGQIPTSQSRS